MAKKIQFLFSLSFCFVLFTLIGGCGSDTVAEKDADSEQVEQKQAPTADSGDKAESTKSEKAEPVKQETAKEQVAEKEVVKEEAKPAAAEKSEGAVALTDKEVVVAKGAVKFFLPTNWESVKPKSFVVEHEIKVPKSEGEAEDAKDGRLTIMGAGGSVDANLERWYGQYSQPDGSESKDAAKLSESSVADCKVTWFDLAGTMLDKPGGPFAGGEMIERENYRTLAAIVQAGGEVGQYFVKVYGPAKTIGDNEAAFKAFVESLVIDADAVEL